MVSNSSNVKSIQVKTGERILELRTKNKLTQEALAFNAEISTTYLGQIERGTRIPTIETIEKICNALSISLAEFFTFSDLPGKEKESLALQSIKVSLSKVPEDVSATLAQIVDELVMLYSK